MCGPLRRAAEQQAVAAVEAEARAARESRWLRNRRRHVVVLLEAAGRVADRGALRALLAALHAERHRLPVVLVLGGSFLQLLFLTVTGRAGGWGARCRGDTVWGKERGPVWCGAVPRAGGDGARRGLDGGGGRGRWTSHGTAQATLDPGHSFLPQLSARPAPPLRTTHLSAPLSAPWPPRPVLPRPAVRVQAARRPVRPAAAGHGRAGALPAAAAPPVRLWVATRGLGRGWGLGFAEPDCHADGLGPQMVA